MASSKTKRRPPWIGRSEAKELRRFLHPLRKLDIDQVIARIDPKRSADESLLLATRLLGAGEVMGCTALVEVAVRVAAAAVYFGGEHLQRQLRSLSWSSATASHQLFAIALWILAQPVARDNDPVFGELTAEKRDVAVMAWLTLHAPIHVENGGLEHEVAKKVLRRTEFDFSTWLTERVPRLAAQYERKTYGE